MYLSYSEYQEYGGALSETIFSVVAPHAEAYIDYWTFNRLWGEEEIPERVRRCMFMLIPLLVQKLQLAGDPTLSKEDLTQTGLYRVKSQSNDDVKVEYSSIEVTEISAQIDSEMERTIKVWLNGVANSLGRRLLYRGLYPGE